MSTFRDHFSGHAADYRAFRPAYPPELFAFLAGVSPAFDLAWDCGTGNGQAAVALADHFARVVATDASANQIAAAQPHPRVEYRVAPAEACPLADGSVDLVTVAQALHWFDADRFVAEARRVSRPGGVVAVWGYKRHRVSAAVDAAIARLEGEFVGPYWPPERLLVEDAYRAIPFPFEELPAPTFELTAAGPLAGFLGYLRTWSATIRFVAERKFDPVAHLADEFAAAWGDPAAVRTVRWDMPLRVGRVH